MDSIQIQGGQALRGEVKVSGAKNAALPILFVSLLTSKKIALSRVPQLEDVRTSIKILENMGVVCERRASGELVLDASGSINTKAPYELVRTMRASVIALGPLIARFGKAEVSLPGGCAIGTRPVDLHLMGLKKLGVQIEIENGYIVARSKRLIGNRVDFGFPSVGATENLMMAACLAKGETLLTNCAREPEIVDLSQVLIKMGAQIEGAGSSEIRIQGRDDLNGCDYEVMGDRIEAGTYLAAALATQGNISVIGIEPSTLESVLRIFEKCGAVVVRGKDRISLKMNQRIEPTDITTEPFPGFPTDMQAQLMAVLCLAQGRDGSQGCSQITETIFENRFMHVPELVRLGAQIEILGNCAVIKGVSKLSGAVVMATDLRASASLVIAGLCAQGQTTVRRIYHLDRGYEGLEKKLVQLGAQVERVQEV